MKLSDLSIRRPVLASMVSLALVLFGAIGYTRLAVREFPDVDPPIVSVSTELPGANPQVVESAVTDILEEELSTVEGLRTLTSSSAEGFSNITLEFNLERGVEAAAQDVRDKVARVRGRLPEDVREPVVAKQEADAQPFYWLALSGENYDLLQLSDIGDRLVKSAPADPARRGPGADLRRAPLLDARVAVRLRAVGPRPDRAGRAAGHPEPQRRGAGRADRIRPPRVHRPLARRAQDPRRVRRARRLQHQRRAGEAQGSRPRRARRRGRAERAPVQGHLVGGHRRRPPVEVQHHPGGRRDPAGAAQDPGVAAARASSSRSGSTSRSSCRARSGRRRIRSSSPRCWW